MSSAQPIDERIATTSLLDFVPTLRSDFVRRDIDGECVVWSPVLSQPVALDSISTVMLDVVDGEASVAELAADVHEAVGVPEELAQQQVAQVIQVFDQAGLLTTSSSATNADDAIAHREVFAYGSTPCTENASRLGTESFALRLGEHTIRVACDGRRGTGMLRSALADHVVEDTEDDPLAFVLTAPQGLKRSHSLVDRSGFVLSAGRGLDGGLHALASHLTAFLPPSSGTVRIRARGIVAGGRIILCLPPLLYAPEIAEAQLARAGLALVDRLAFDIDVRTGTVANPAIPWPTLDALGAGVAHAGTGGATVVAAIVDVALKGSVPRTQGAIVAAIAANGVAGTLADLLDAAIKLVQGAQVRATEPTADPLIELMTELGSRPSGR